MEPNSILVIPTFQIVRVTAIATVTATVTSGTLIYFGQKALKKLKEKRPAQ